MKGNSSNNGEQKGKSKDVSPLMPGSESGAFSCRYCRKQFSSGQALGGHQNSHRSERAIARRPRMHGHIMPQNSSSLVPIYPKNHSLFPNRVSPQLPLGHANNFTHPYSSMHFSPNTKLTTGLNFNTMGIEGSGRRSGMLEGFPSLNNGDMMRSDFNSLGIKHNKGSSLDGGFLKLSENTCFPVAGYEAGGTSSTMKGYIESDGTIDLLSKVGHIDNTEDAETNGDICVNRN